MLPDEQSRMVDAILTRTLPKAATTWIFGSRATGKVRRASDLDLAIDAGRPLTRQELLTLGEAFESSDLPFKVDLVDYSSVGTEFRAIIDRTKIAWQGVRDG